VRIADFGLACFYEEGVPLYQKCGTPGYVAPEMLRELGYSTKADIFSLGVIMFNLLTGKNVFKGTVKEEILRNNKWCFLSHLNGELSHVSKYACDLIHLMLIDKPKKRPSAREAL
jgi:calcium/calmodulin-dependent protein kinase I